MINYHYKKRTLINSYNLNLKKAYKRFYFISIILQVGLYLGFMIPNIILIKDPFNIIAVYLCSFILFFSIIIYLVSAPFDGKR